MPPPVGLEQYRNQIKIPTPEMLAQEQDWIWRQIQEIGEDQLRGNIFAALQARKLAYAPYSGYFVGASLLSVSGHIYSGANQEGANYSGTRHAETVSISQAIMAGEIKNDPRFIKALVVAHPGESGPCGDCLQAIREHAHDDDVLILDVKTKGDKDGDVVMASSLNVLQLFGFGPAQLDFNK